MKRLLIVVLSLVFAVACGKKDEEKKEDGEKKVEKASALDAGQEFALEGITEDLTLVKKLLEEGKPEDTTYKCAAAKGYAETLAGVKNDKVKAALKDLDAICGFGAPYATARQAGDKIEEALKSDPETKYPSECAPLGTSLDDIAAAHKEKDEVKALVELHAKVCN
jgi:hypothetical protein